MSTNSAKSAKHITECGYGGDDGEDNDARQSFEIAQKKTRVAASQGSDNDVALTLGVWICQVSKAKKNYHISYHIFKSFLMY